MQRNISVSMDVFAAIWAHRKTGENTEDEILRRTFGCEPSSASSSTQTDRDSEGGVYDVRNGVHFPEGFRVFRNYKRREYSAEARGGSWVRSDTEVEFPTLNQLNASIVAGMENVWNGNWKYRTPDGATRSIAELRG
ncbi:MAG: hypothetical protein ABJ215_00250 [Alphaproteobacteria bacterium]